MRRTNRSWLWMAGVVVLSMFLAGAAQAATIQGQITGTPNPDPAKTFAVVYYGTDGCSAAYLTYGIINGSGNFSISDLPPTTGTGKQYFLKTWSDETQGETFVDTWFKLSDTSGTYNCSEARGFSFTTSSETAYAGTLNLAQGYSISGTVAPTGNPYTDKNGTEFANTYVLVLKPTTRSTGGMTDGCDSPIYMIAPTGNAGSYKTDSLPGGEYYLQTYSYNTYVSTWWTTGSATTTACANATKITLNADITGDNFSLDNTGGTISGTVSGLGDFSKILINVYDYDTSKSCNQGRWVTTAFVDSSSGEYTTPGLIPNSYILQSYSVDGAFTNEYYAAGGSTTNCSGLTLVDVTAGSATTGKDFNLDSIVSTTISGTVFHSGTTTAITGRTIYINVYESTKPGTPVAGVCYQGKWVTTAVVNSSGSYTTPYLPAGKYLLQSYSKDGFLNEWYKSTGSSSAYYCKDASEVQTTSGNTPSINFYLDAESE